MHMNVYFGVERGSPIVTLGPKCAACRGFPDLIVQRQGLGFRGCGLLVWSFRVSGSHSRAGFVGFFVFSKLSLRVVL